MSETALAAQRENYIELSGRSRIQTLNNKGRIYRTLLAVGTVFIFSSNIILEDKPTYIETHSVWLMYLCLHWENRSAHPNLLQSDLHANSTDATKFSQ